MKLPLMIAAGLLVTASSATAGQWVKGNVQIVEDYTAFDSTQGLLVTLINQTWGGGDQTNGATVCLARFSAVVGQESVTQSLYDRMYAALLTASATGRIVALWVDTSVSPNCRIQIVSYGRTDI